MKTWIHRFVAASPAPRARVLFERVCSFSSVLLLLSTGFVADAGAAVIPSGDVWLKAEEVGRRNDIDPLLIYSIACAESSLNDRADSGRARGLMQLTRGAWEDVSDLSYDKAWEWRTNMEVSGKYLHKLRLKLENSGHYSWPLLAASYHYGPYRVARAKYRMNRLPRASNTIYNSMFAGRMPTLPGKIPRREIDRPAPIQVFAKEEPKYTIVLPALRNETFENIPPAPGSVLEFPPIEITPPGDNLANLTSSGEEEKEVVVKTETPADTLDLPPLLQRDEPESLAMLNDLGLPEFIADKLREAGTFVASVFLVPEAKDDFGGVNGDGAHEPVAALPVKLDTSVDSIIGGASRSGNPTSTQ